MKKHILTAVISAALTTSVVAETPSLEELWALVQQQQTEIAKLKAQLAENEEKIAESTVAAEAAFVAIEDVQQAQSASSGVNIGGYGELHYNNLETDSGNAKKEEFDFHRFVLFFNYDYGDSVRFFSEFELEHSIAGEGKAGEIELEQAYIEWDVADDHSAKAGLFLIPVGLLNETHEPDTFYGVERNNVESAIVPSTWWEGGLGLSGELADGVSYDFAAHSGLFINPAAGKYKIRDGRQKVGKAKGSDLAYTARLKYTAIPGLELAATLQYQEDVQQGQGVSAVDGWLFEGHMAYQSGPFNFKALYAKWSLDDAMNLVQTGAAEQSGYYIEPSYRFSDDIGVFTRYSVWDNTADSAADTETSQWDIGVNYWLTKRVVLKADYQNQDNNSGSGYDGFNLGFGYSF